MASYKDKVNSYFIDKMEMPCFRDVCVVNNVC